LAQLDQIVRQKDSESLWAGGRSNHRTPGTTGRIAESADPKRRLEAMSRSYASARDRCSQLAPNLAGFFRHLSFTDLIFSEKRE
jgi:hypothetical protein